MLIAVVLALDVLVIILAILVLTDHHSGDKKGERETYNAEETAEHIKEHILNELKGTEVEWSQEKLARMRAEERRKRKKQEEER